VRRLFVIVGLCAVLLVAGAIVGAIVRDPAPEQLSQGEYATMARAIGLTPRLTLAVDRQQRMCGRPLPDDVDEGLRALDRDCRVSAQLADHKDALNACIDVACARREAAAVVATARASEAIERFFARRLSGGCARFFDVEAQYGQDTAEAADRLLVLPGQPLLDPAMRIWRRDSLAAEERIDAEPVLELLAACRP
jgi:hypothetical protein